MRPAHRAVQNSRIAVDPYIHGRLHDVNKIRFYVENWGISGVYPDISDNYDLYPAGKHRLYATPSFGIGAVVGRDTLVSIYEEFQPTERSHQFEVGDTVKMYGYNGAPDDQNYKAKSDQDIIVAYTDTVLSSGWTIGDDLTGRPHIPIGVRVKQTSYAWSYRHAEDFLIFDYEVAGLNLQEINSMYFLVLNSGGATSGIAPVVAGFDDDITGFIDRTTPKLFKEEDCNPSVYINFAWAADDDGDPVPIDTTTLGFGERSPTDVMGIMILSGEDEFKDLNYSWWHRGFSRQYDFGPRMSSRPGRPFRDYPDGLGTPRGDLNLYDLASNGERDYNQLFTAIDHSSEGWLRPPQNADQLCLGAVDGYTVSALSLGPYHLSPGETIHFTFAFVGGENLHRDPRNKQDNWLPYAPQSYIDHLNFNYLTKNAVYAKWVYDNPGVDTDGDGYRGSYSLCEYDSALTRYVTIVDSTNLPPVTYTILDTVSIIPVTDTIWNVGDGVADLRAATPPPQPNVRVSTETGSIILEWNGLKSETTPDVFTREIDFEGYRVYFGYSPLRADLGLVSSYDIPDYTQWYFNPTIGDPFHPGLWVTTRRPFSLIEAQIAYGKGQSTWNPLNYGIDNPIRSKDSLFYFTTQDWNQSDLSDTMQIHKIYPNAPYPHTLILDSAFTEDTLWVNPISGDSVFYAGGELTPDGERFKYFDYRYVFDNLLPSQVYFVAVTTFDYGSPLSGLPFLETDPSENTIRALAQDRVSENQELDVVVYPNPYRIDGNYRDRGFEGRGSDLPDERTRLVHFTNLPPQCDIKIYTLDGDMVRQIIHDKSPGAADAMHDTWDVLSRNLQVPVSGIYYWVVETPDGRTQLGKLVLIM